jgi:6-phosphogluconolactonase
MSSARDKRQAAHARTHVVLCRDIEELTEQAAELFVRRARAAIAARGRFTVAVSGCGLPMALNARLATHGYTERVPWSQVHVFWTDETYLPTQGRQSRFQLVQEALLSRVQIPKSNVYAPPTGSLDCHRAATEYEQTMRAFFGLDAGQLPRFDMIWLEMGADGHAAALFPGSSAVEETERMVAATYVKQLGEHRLTLTAPAISNAATVALLVAGETRAAALREALSSAYQPERSPTQLIRPVDGELFYFVERTAGSELRPTGT